MNSMLTQPADGIVLFDASQRTPATGIQFCAKEQSVSFCIEGQPPTDVNSLTVTFPDFELELHCLVQQRGGLPAIHKLGLDNNRTQCVLGIYSNWRLTPLAPVATRQPFLGYALLRYSLPPQHYERFAAELQKHGVSITGVSGSTFYEIGSPYTCRLVQFTQVVPVPRTDDYPSARALAGKLLCAVTSVLNEGKYESNTRFEFAGVGYAGYDKDGKYAGERR